MAVREEKAPPTAPQAPGKRKIHRSPIFPFIALPKAVERARELYAEEKRHPTPAKVAVAHWKYAAKSSGGLQTLAALKHFGLLADSGSGADRKVHLTDLAARILLDTTPDSAEVREALKTAAITPKLHAELWQKWEANLPSDANIRNHLIFEREFNPASADQFIRQYRDTLAFARLAESVNMSLPEDREREPPVDQDMGFEGETFDSGKESPPATKTGVRVFSFPVADLVLEVRVRGQLTPDKVPLVDQYLELVKASLKSEMNP